MFDGYFIEKLRSVFVYVFQFEVLIELLAVVVELAVDGTISFMSGLTVVGVFVSVELLLVSFDIEEIICFSLVLFLNIVYPIPPAIARVITTRRVIPRNPLCFFI